MENYLKQMIIDILSAPVLVVAGSYRGEVGNHPKKFFFPNSHNLIFTLKNTLQFSKSVSHLNKLNAVKETSIVVIMFLVLLYVSLDCVRFILILKTSYSFFKVGEQGGTVDVTPTIRAENGPICGYRIVNPHKGKIPFEVIMMMVKMMIMMMIMVMIKAA